MSWARPPSATTAVTSASGRPRKTASSTKWLLLTGKRGAVDVRALWSDPSIPRPVASTDYPALEKVADMAIREKQKFERLVVPKETLLEMFAVCIIPLCRARRGLTPLSTISITSTRSTSSRRRFPTARPPLCTVVVLWWIYVSDLTSLTRARSRP